MATSPLSPKSFDSFMNITATEVANMAFKLDGDLLFLSDPPTLEMVRHGYRIGLFAMPLDHLGLGNYIYGWFFPKVRGVISIPPPINSKLIKVPKSLRRSAKSMTVTVNCDFGKVIQSCAEADRPGKWINAKIIKIYSELHHLGEAYSIEVWDKKNPTELIGGLYGVAFEDFFAGESMFHKRTDASKVALLALMDLAEQKGWVMVDTQWITPHLEYMGATAIPWNVYLEIIDSESQGSD